MYDYSIKCFRSTRLALDEYCGLLDTPADTRLQRRCVRDGRYLLRSPEASKASEASEWVWAINGQSTEGSQQASQVTSAVTNWCGSSLGR